MDKIFEIFNFDDIGGKMKTWAKWICWIFILIIWICCAIAFLGFLFTEGMFLLALLMPIVAILYSVLIWISCWSMYAFGKLVDDNHNQTSKIDNIDKNIQIIVQPMIREAEEKAKREAERKAKLEAERKAKLEAVKTASATETVAFIPTENGNIICTHCKTEQKADRKVCWKCGAKFVPQ